MASIRQFPNGRWQAQVRRRGLVPTAKTFGTKSQAERWARLVESEIDRGVFVDRSEAERTTVAELIERYLKEVTPGKKSWRNEAQRLRFLARRFGRYSAAAIRTPDLVQYRDQRLQAGLAHSTVAKELNSLSKLFDTAIRDWGLPLISNPAKLVRRPAPGKARERRLLPGEEEKILAACRASQAQLLAAVVEVAIHTGMRLGELLALDWRNIDFGGRVAWLPETRRPAKGVAYRYPAEQWQS
jgi:integrase